MSTPATETRIDPLEELYHVPASETAEGSPNLPGTRRESVAITVLFTLAYAVLGYFTVVSGHVVQFEALDRLGDAYMTWWNDPPKLAAIGLSHAPIGTLVFLPLALVKPLATSLVALPLISALAAAATLAMLNALMARCEVRGWVRFAVVALIGLNPLFAFYAVNGTPVAVGLFLAAAALMALVSWGIMDETRYLVGAGMAIGCAVLVDYVFIAWALAILLAIAFVGPGKRAGQAKLRAGLLLFLTPVTYAILIWTLLNGVILDNPLQWLETGEVQTIANLNPVFASASASLGTALGDLASAALGAAPLAFVVLPLLAIVALGRRDALGFGLLTVLLFAAGSVVGLALLEDRAAAVSLGATLPLLVASIAAAAWLHRREGSWRGLMSVLLLAGVAAAVPLSWMAMREYEHQDLEQAFTRFVQTRESQEGTRSLGGYRVGIDPERAMADYVDNRLRPPANSILTDSSVTYGPILLSGKPNLFVDRADLSDGDWKALLDEPFGRVPYMLVSTSGNSDLIRDKYPGIALGAQPGLVPIFHTAGYVLVQVEAARGVGPASAPAADQQPRLITPSPPLSPPPPVTDAEAGLSPLPGEPSPAGSAATGGASSAPRMEGE